MRSAGVPFGRTTRGGWDFDTFARLLGRLPRLLIAIDYDAIQMRDANAIHIQPIRYVAWGPLLSAACLSGRRDKVIRLVSTFQLSKFWRFGVPKIFFETSAVTGARFGYITHRILPVLTTSIIGSGRATIDIGKLIRTESKFNVVA
jgi:hypothetical protein